MDFDKTWIKFNTHCIMKSFFKLYIIVDYFIIHILQGIKPKQMKQLLKHLRHFHSFQKSLFSEKKRPLHHTMSYNSNMTVVFRLLKKFQRYIDILRSNNLQ